MRNIFLYPVEAINSIRSNVWAVGLIVAGLFLTKHGDSVTGTSLTTGGFAILRGESSGASVSPPPIPNPQSPQPQDPQPKI